MGEDERLLEAAHEALAGGRAGAALATVLAVDGSAYRREGSRMLVLADGTRVGGVSGGCLEAEVADMAAEVVREGGLRVLRFDTTDAQDAVMGYGSGCAAVIDVLVEPLGAPDALLVLTAVAAVRRTRRPGLLLTLVSGPDAGARAWLHGGAWSGPLTDRLGYVLPPPGRPTGPGLAGRTVVQTPQGSARAVWEVLEPPVHLVHVGADAGAAEVAELARPLGWDVTVLDFRPALLDRLHVPRGTALVRSGGDELARHVQPDARTALVVASRQWLYDQAALRTFLADPCRGDQHERHAPGEPPLYLGLIGSQERVGALLGAALDGRPAPAHLRAPAGLSLGARSPAEIALSVVSEVLAARTEHVAPAHRRGGADHPPPAVPPVLAATAERDDRRAALTPR